jgi:hypothetical protein
MPAYWWQCENCANTFDFLTACGSKGMPNFIRDVLLPSNWNQNHLCIECPACHKQTLRIVYEFPRANKETIRVIHIVGLGNIGDSYIPMMWETIPAPYYGNTWFDFKYINNRSIYGLNKPAVFEREDLKKLFQLYREKTYTTTFP